METSWFRRTFLALESTHFRLLFFGTLFAQLTFAMKNVVQGIVAFDLTGKNSSVGLVALGTGLTMVFFGPLGGALGDRLPKKQLLLVSQSVIGLSFGVVGILVVTDRITIPLLTASTLVLGTMFAVMGPTRQAWIGELLSGPHLANGIALQQIAMNGTRIIGPFLVGFLVSIAFMGAGGTYLFMCGTFGVVVAMLWLMPSTGRADTSGRNVFADLSAGFRYINGTGELRLLALTFLGTVVTAFSYQTLLPGFLKYELGRPTSDLGWFYGVSAVGGLGITLFLAGRASTTPRSVMYLVGSLLGVGLIALALAPNAIVALGAMFIIGAFSSAFQLLNNVNLMRACEPAFYGRVMSVTMMSFGVNSIAAFPVGVVADQVGERLTLAGCAVGVLLVMAAGRTASQAVGRRVEAARVLAREDLEASPGG